MCGVRVRRACCSLVVRTATNASNAQQCMRFHAGAAIHSSQGLQQGVGCARACARGCPCVLVFDWGVAAEGVSRAPASPWIPSVTLTARRTANGPQRTAALCYLSNADRMVTVHPQEGETRFLEFTFSISQTPLFAFCSTPDPHRHLASTTPRVAHEKSARPTSSHPQAETSSSLTSQVSVVAPHNLPHSRRRQQQ